MKFFVFSFAFLLGWDGVGWKYLDAILNELSRKKTIVLFCALYQFCKIAFQFERRLAPPGRDSLSSGQKWILKAT